MLLPVFENYFLDGDMSGYTQEQWDTIIEEYNGLLGEEGGNDAMFNIVRHTELVVQYEAWITALNTVENLFNGEPKIYATGICIDLAKRFKPLKFSKESLLQDLDIARSKLKALIIQINEVKSLLPTEEQGKINSTFFDDICFAYREVFQAPLPDKDRMTVQSFAIAYKRLKERIEQENNKNKVKDDG